MSYYIRDALAAPNVLSTRRPTINEYFLSSYTLSIYSGCEFGCPYCDGWVYDPRSFSQQIRVPLDLPQRLAIELNQVDRGDLIAITALSDPYQPAEQSFRIMRQVLQHFADRGQPCLIMTKSPAILEDISLLQRINEQSLAIVMTTLITLDHNLAERLEGRAPPPTLRLDMLTALQRAGIPVGVAVVPVIPYVNDTDYAMRRLLQACAERKVDFVVWDYLYVPDRYHRNRVSEMLAQIGSYPSSYYRDIYGDQIVVNADYRAERNLQFLKRCDMLGLNVHAPHRLYMGKLAPRNEAALVLKHTGFRSLLSGQQRVSLLHRELADQIYTGTVTTEQIQSSPLAATLQGILG
ncbi:MAG: radical SAM protein [Chloroflexaceae bacterium]|nr:radical SAM protein [Chloroflexaceae bacterium]NJO06046.1 radical SAM protein [Chloroflexaceae bacterium]